MKIGLTHYITGSIVVLMAGGIYINVRKKRRDNKAMQLMGKIQSRLISATYGIASENAFDIHYLNKVLQQAQGQVLVLKKSSALKLADQIHRSWKPWYQGGDDETQVYDVFRKLKDKVQVSQVANAYSEAYSNNLVEVLKERLTKHELKKVLDIVQKQPNYRIS